MRKTFEGLFFNVDLIDQWDAILFPKDYNWVDFEFIRAYLDIDRVHGHTSVELYLLGFGIRIYWVYNRTNHEKKMIEYQEILENEEFIPVEDL